MVLKIQLKHEKFNDLLELFESSGEATRLRLARHILAQDGASLDVLLSLFDLVNEQRWHEFDLYNLKPRLYDFVIEPKLFIKLSTTLESQNDMQKCLALKILTKIGNPEVVPLVFPYLACSIPCVGWPAIELVTALAVKEDWVAIGNREDWQKNRNEHMRLELEKEIALHV